MICGSAAEKVYTGCERIMARLAAQVDMSPVMHSDGWHAALLRRMAAPYPGRRDQIISAACLALLDKARSFRHRERNSYGVSLDTELVVFRAGEMLDGLALFRTEVTEFLDRS